MVYYGFLFSIASIEVDLLRDSSRCQHFSLVPTFFYNGEFLSDFIFLHVLGLLTEPLESTSWLAALGLTTLFHI